VRLLGQTGLVGTALFAAFLGLLAVAAARARRHASIGGRARSAAALAGFLAWLVHASVDWLWAFPGLVVPALALLAVAARLDDRPEAPDTGAVAMAADEAGPAGGARRVAAGVLAVVVGLSLAAPGLAARFSSAAYGDFATDPASTLARLDRAASLNPLSAEPLIARGILARRSGNTAIALDAFRRAVDRSPSNWFAQFELALEDGMADRRAEALAAAARAKRLNPRQRAVTQLLRELEGGKAVVAAEYEAMLQEQLTKRLKPVGGGA
jgi:tetratricopeptide (TPR) repeat protein